MPSTSSRPLPWCEHVPPGRPPGLLPFDEQVLLAIGITSTAERIGMRDGQRATWLAKLPADVKAHFILRGANLPEAARIAAADEAARHGDVLFVTASANLSRATGPLNSVFLWLRCASLRYPHTPFVGKAEDDVWLNPSAVATLLRSHILPWVGKPYEAYIGAIATYHWDERSDGGPIGYREIPCTVPCAQQQQHKNNRTSSSSPSPLVGLFNFMKGPFLVLSQKLSRLVAHVPLRTAQAVDVIGTDGQPTGAWRTAASASSGSGGGGATTEASSMDPRCLRGSSWFWTNTATNRGIRRYEHNKHAWGRDDDGDGDGDGDGTGEAAAPEEERYEQVCGGRRQDASAGDEQPRPPHEAPPATSASSGRDGILRNTTTSSSQPGRWGTTAWDDVWLGYALSQLRTGRVALVALGDELFDDTWGFAAKETALLWHSRADADMARRVIGLERWAAQSGCVEVLRRRGLSSSAYRLTCHAKMAGAATVLTCASQPWLLCRARGRLHEGTHEGTSNCSARKVELWGRPSGVWLDVPTTRMVRIRGVWTQVNS